MSRTRTALGILRQINAVDLLLPIGGALIASGMHNLAERETRQRQRLAALQSAVQTHLDALLAAGVEVPAGLAVDERHPLDAPGLAAAINGITGNSNSKTSSNSYPDGGESPRRRRRGWKLAAAGLAGAAGIVYAFRGHLAAAVLPYLEAAGADEELAEEVPRFYPGREYPNDAPFGPIDTVTVPDPVEAGPWTGDACEKCGQPIWWFVDEQVWRHIVPGHERHPYARWSTHQAMPAPAVNEEAPAPWDRAEPVAATYPPHSHDYTAAGSTCSVCGAADVAFAGLQEPDDPVDPAEQVAALAESVNGPDPLGDECGWEGCSWAPKETTHGAARVTALAVHRARCVHRPPSLMTPGS